MWEGRISLQMGSNPYIHSTTYTILCDNEMNTVLIHVRIYGNLCIAHLLKEPRNLTPTRQTIYAIYTTHNVHTPDQNYVYCVLKHSRNVNMYIPPHSVCLFSESDKAIIWFFIRSLQSTLGQHECTYMYIHGMTEGYAVYRCIYTVHEILSK